MFRWVRSLIVNRNWLRIEKQNIVKERNVAKTKEQRDELTRILNYMNRVEMAVIVSEEADENIKFQQQGLDISVHRQKMNAVTPEGLDIEDRFKDPDDPLQLVFVCAMWLTGFDVESLPTLYLDKPMKGHTLMQAIARANRVYPNKPCGIVVDYVNVFKYMRKALSEYAAGDDGGEYPAKDIDKLIDLIDQTIGEADDFLMGLGIDIGAIVAEASTLERLDQLREAYNTIISHDESKEKFKVILNTLMNLYSLLESAFSSMMEGSLRDMSHADYQTQTLMFQRFAEPCRVERRALAQSFLGSYASAIHSIDCKSSKTLTYVRRMRLFSRGDTLITILWLHCPEDQTLEKCLAFRKRCLEAKILSFLPSSRECTYHIGIAKFLDIERDNSEDYVYVNANDFPDGCADICDAQAFLDKYQSTLMGKKAKYINAEEYSDIVEARDIPYPWQ